MESLSDVGTTSKEISDKLREDYETGRTQAHSVPVTHDTLLCSYRFVPLR
jgi:hypothetical protein